MARRRLNLDDLTTAELVSRGAAAARVGETEEARKLLEEATRREPDNAEAWLWLTGARAEPRGKREAFERVLELRPGDSDAEAGLQRLAEKYGAAVLEDEDDLETLRCTWHPDRETLLRCNRCGRPMCPDCSRRHPIGLRCKSCAKETRSPIYKLGARNVAGALALGLPAGFAAAVLASLALAFFGGFFALIIGFFVGRALGVLVAEAVHRGSGRKRGRALQWIAAIAIGLGGLLAPFTVVQLAALAGQPVPLPNLLGVLVYAAVAAGAAGSRLG